jgi:hypothetical protein
MDMGKKMCNRICFFLYEFVSEQPDAASRVNHDYFTARGADLDTGGVSPVFIVVRAAYRN